jgi:bacteriocin-like protein
MNDEKVDPSKKDQQISSADDLVKLTELSEEELKRISGGGIYMKYPGIPEGSVTTEGFQKWIEL